MKRILILAMALLLCVGFVACGQIEDANGEEETGLAVITKDELLESNSSSKVGYVRTQINNTLTNNARQPSLFKRSCSTVEDGLASVSCGYAF